MDQLVDLNEANAAELMRLPGIGPGLAARIIAYRQENPIHTAGQLARIPGISARMAVELVPLVKLDYGAAPHEVEALPAAPEEATGAAIPETSEPQNEQPHESWSGVSMTPELEEEPASEGLALEEPAGPTMDEPVAELADEAAVEPSHPAPDEDEAPDTDEPHESWSGVSLTPELDDELAEAELAGAHLADNQFSVAAVTPDEPTDMAEPAPIFPEPEQLTPEPEPVRPAFAPAAPESAGNARNDLASMLQLTGCRGPLVALFGGAIFGTLLTLLLLFIFNGGSLLFADVERVNQLQDEQGVLHGEIDGLQDELVTAAAAQGDLEAELEAAAAEQGQLRTTITYMETRVEGVGPAAERLDTFIVGMREFLNELATPPPPTMTPFATNTPATGATEPAADATRTPRPTFTPLATPTP
ncbi:MAG: helix-hairpin-helix domain-containing protein [Anaerolineales bacterium]|nr:helix-hairpin-helix domain-containing protein [Anaerolineales bacterium]